MSLSNDDFAKDPSGPRACDETFRVDMTQEEFDRQFFDQILRRGANNSDVLRRQAELHSHANDHQAALKLDRRLARRFPHDPVVFYNLACSLSMTGEQGEAIEALSRAVELGYNDFAHIEADSDLDALRDLPDYLELISRGVV